MLPKTQANLDACYVSILSNDAISLRYPCDLRYLLYINIKTRGELLWTNTKVY